MLQVVDERFQILAPSDASKDGHCSGLIVAGEQIPQLLEIRVADCGFVESPLPCLLRSLTWDSGLEDALDIATETV